jgi:hypothetical protein
MSTQDDKTPADVISEATGGLPGYAERRRLRAEAIAKADAEKMAKLRKSEPRHPAASSEDRSSEGVLPEPAQAPAEPVQAEAVSTDGPPKASAEDGPDEINMDDPTTGWERQRLKAERIARERHVVMCGLRGFDPDDTTGGPA